MSLLYTISNVCIPFSLLVYETVKRKAQKLQPNYGKWLVLFVVTFLFNGLTLLNSWIITLVDLCIKIGLFYLPEHMNEIIEDRIRNLHLQGIIQSYRCKIVNKIFDGFNHSMHFLLKQLREEERGQFQDALIEGLQNNKSNIQLVIEPKEKLMTNAEVQCLIISDKTVEEARALFDRKLKYIEKEKEEMERAKLELEKEKRPNSKKKHEAEKEFPQVKAEKQSKNKVDVVSRDMLQTMPAGGFKNKKVEKQGKKELSPASSIKNLQQSSQFLPEDFQEEPEKPVSKLRYSRNSEEKTAEKRSLKKSIKDEGEVGGLRRSNTTLQGLKINSSNVASRERSYSPEGSSLRQQAQILEKLDLSVSEYSDMFQEDQVEEDKEEANKLICKVQAIVQIGAAPSARLEIYNLELYSNKTLRIVSLYNREFQKHKLVSISKGANQYYELNLTGGAVNKRLVKFRGQCQPFLKYLQ